MEFPFEARLLFIGLWTLADREGRLEDKPRQIKVDIFPGDDVDCNALLDLLASTDMLIRYQVDGKRYLQVCNFTKHQNPHRDERASTLPQPGASCAENSPANGGNGAGSVQAPCEHSESMVQIGLTPDSGLLTPDSRLLTPDSRLLTPDSPTNTQTPSLPRESADPPSSTTKAGAVCVVLKSEGVGHVNPSHPELLQLLEAGAQVGQFSEAAKLAVSKKKGTFAYVLGIVRKQMQDVSELSRPPPPGEAPMGYETPYQRSMRESVEAWAPAVARKAPGRHSSNLASSENRNVVIS